MSFFTLLFLLLKNLCLLTGLDEGLVDIVNPVYSHISVEICISFICECFKCATAPAWFLVVFFTSETMVSSVCTQNKQSPRVEEKFSVALLLTLPGKRSWLLSLPLQEEWFGGETTYGKGVKSSPSTYSFHPVCWCLKDICLMPFSSNRSSSPSSPGMCLALLSSASLKIHSLSDPCTDHMDLICDKTLHILMSSQKTSHCEEKKNPMPQAGGSLSP